MCPNFLDWDVIMQSLSALFVVSQMVLQQLLLSTSLKDFSLSALVTPFLLAEAVTSTAHAPITDGPVFVRVFRPV